MSASGTLVPFGLGTRVAVTIPCVDPATGVGIADSTGAAGTLTILPPDHPSVARARNYALATSTLYESELLTHGPAGEDGKPTKVVRSGLDPARVADLIQMQTEAQVEYAAQLVTAWSFDAECTPAAVRALCDRAPFVYALIKTLTADDDRFFPTSSLRAPSTPAVSSEAAA